MLTVGETDWLAGMSVLADYVGFGCELKLLLASISDACVFTTAEREREGECVCVCVRGNSSKFDAEHLAFCVEREQSN